MLVPFEASKRYRQNVHWYGNEWSDSCADMSPFLCRYRSPSKSGDFIVRKIARARPRTTFVSALCHTMIIMFNPVEQDYSRQLSSDVLLRRGNLHPATSRILITTSNLIAARRPTWSTSWCRVLDERTVNVHHNMQRVETKKVLRQTLAIDSFQIPRSAKHLLTSATAGDPA